MDFRLSVRPATRSRPWRATLERPDRTGLIEFASPLELVRHLEALGRTEQPGPGLR